MGAVDLPLGPPEGNDLGQWKGKSFTPEVVDDFQMIKQMWPGMQLVWLALFSYAWRGTQSACIRHGGVSTLSWKRPYW